MLKNNFLLTLLILAFSACDSKRNEGYSIPDRIILKDEKTVNFFKGRWLYTGFQMVNKSDRFKITNDEYFEFEIMDSTFNINNVKAGKWKLYSDGWNKFIHLDIQNLKYENLIFNEEDLKISLIKRFPQFFDATQFFSNNKGKTIGISHHFLRKEESAVWLKNNFPEKYNETSK